MGHYMVLGFKLSIFCMVYMMDNWIYYTTWFRVQIVHILYGIYDGYTTLHGFRVQIVNILYGIYDGYTTLHGFRVQIVHICMVHMMDILHYMVLGFHMSSRDQRVRM